jgi:type IV secretory pathway VirJ component
MSPKPRRAATALAAGLLLTITTGIAAASDPPAATTPAQTDPTQPKKPTTKLPAADPTDGETHLPAGRFGKVTVYIPEGTPQSVAIFLSGDGGWNLGVISMAKALVDMGAVVIGVDIRQYLGALGKAAQRENAPCQLIAGDFENLSHQIQKEIGMFVYHVPVLVGYSSGATVVYAALVQSPPGTFAGALSLGFCPDQDFSGAALCPGVGLHYTQGKKTDPIFEPAKTLKQPWIAFQGQKDEVCGPAPVDVFAAATTNAQVVKLPLVGHGFSVERNWMPPELRARVATVTLLGVDSNASFEIRIADWVGSDDNGPPTRPEVAAIGGVPVLCIYGEGESDSICPGLPQSPEHAKITLAEVGKGHHFSGEYSTLAERILAFARSGPQPTT